MTPDPTAPLWHSALAAPHRPLFVAAGAWALVVVALTAWPGGAGPAASPLGGLADWHAHEMVFGFAAAAFAGYALSAMAGWSGGSTLTRRRLLALLAAWLIGRLAAWGHLGQDPRLIAPAGAAFMAALAVTLGLAAWRAGAWRGAAQAALAAMLGAVQVAILLGADLRQAPVLGFVLLLSGVGGRIVAACSWNRIDSTAAPTGAISGPSGWAGSRRG
ncbi:MAG: NnrS family protein [Paracoccaceae bacterium]